MQFLEIDVDDSMPDIGNFDAIFSVESSHCYRDFERCLAQARGMLNEGGTFAIADVRQASAVPDFLGALKASKMHLQEFQDITNGVIGGIQWQLEEGLVWRLDGPPPKFIAFARDRLLHKLNLYTSGRHRYLKALLRNQPND